jgi:Protein of unknown function (DUF1566)
MNVFTFARLRWMGGVAFAAWALSAHAADRSTEPTLVLSEDGAAIVDIKTKQVWPRCVEGMHWSGKTCSGEPLLLTHAEAVALAATRKKADGANWRLPRVTDLQRLTGRNTNHPGLDPDLFPAAPRQWHWAMTANIKTDVGQINQYNYGNITQGRTSSSVNQMAFLHGWAVNLTTGEARSDFAKNMALPVRLVRPQNF